jgi:hypothetical protein
MKSLLWPPAALVKKGSIAADAAQTPKKNAVSEMTGG